MDSAGTTLCFFFFFNDTATTEIYTLSLHDALPIYISLYSYGYTNVYELGPYVDIKQSKIEFRSEEHTSELQSLTNIVCRLLLEKKKKIYEVILEYGKASVTTHRTRTMESVKADLAS